MRLALALNLNRRDGSDCSLARRGAVAVCAGPLVLLLDSRRARFVARLVGHTAAVHAARFVPRPVLDGSPCFDDESELLSCGADATVRVWERSGGVGVFDGEWRCVAVLTGHTASVASLAVLALPCGDAVAASVSSDCSLRLWRRDAAPAATWVAVACLQLRPASVMECVALSLLPGLESAGCTVDPLRGVVVAAGGADARVHLYLPRRALDSAAPATSAAIALTAATRAKASPAAVSLEFELSEMLSLQGHSDCIRALSFSHHGLLRGLFGGRNCVGADGPGAAFLMLASAAQDGKVRLWRLSQRAEAAAFVAASAAASLATAMGSGDSLSDAAEVGDVEGEDEQSIGGRVGPESKPARLVAVSAADFDRMLLSMDDEGAALGGGGSSGGNGAHSLLRRPSTFSVAAFGSGRDVSSADATPAPLFEVLHDSLLSGHDGWLHAVRWHPPLALLQAIGFGGDPGARRNVGAFAPQPPSTWRLWQPPCLVAASSDKTVSIWQPAGASAGHGGSTGSTGTNGHSSRERSDREGDSQWSGVWKPVARVGSGFGSSSLGMFGATLTCDGATLISHGFQGALHVWRSSDDRDDDSSGNSNDARRAAVDESGVCLQLRVLQRAADFDLAARTRRRPSLAWRAVAAPGGHFRAVADIAWAAGGQYLLSCGDDCTTRVWAPVAMRPEVCGKQQALREGVTDVGGSGDVQWHEVFRPQIHGYELVALAAAGRSHSHRVFTAGDEKVLRCFDAPQLFLATLTAVCGPALEASGYGSITDESVGDDGDDGWGTAGGAGDQIGARAIVRQERAAFAYVPELSLTNKPVFVAGAGPGTFPDFMTEADALASAATPADRFHLDGRDDLQRKHDIEAASLRGLATAGRKIAISTFFSKHPKMSARSVKWTAEEEHAMMELYEANQGAYDSRNGIEKLCKEIHAAGFVRRSEAAIRSRIKMISESGYLDDQVEREETAEEEEEQEEEESTPAKAKAKAKAKSKGKGKAKAKAATPSSSSKKHWSEDEDSALLKYADKFTHEWRGSEVPDFKKIVVALMDDGFPERTPVAARAHYAKL